MVWMPDMEIVEDLKHVPFLRAAYIYGFDRAKDDSTRNGAVLVDKNEWIVAFGACGFPEFLEDLPERHERPLKYSYVKHAERDVIYNAAKKEGISTKDLRMYCPWYACSDCAIGIISSGIEEVIGHEDTFLRTPERWQETIDIAVEMLHEAGVGTFMYRGKIGGVNSILNGEHWEP